MFTLYSVNDVSHGKMIWHSRTQIVFTNHNSTTNFSIKLNINILQTKHEPVLRNNAALNAYIC